MEQFLSPDDLKKGALIDPAWYPVELADYKEEAADTDKSTNSLFYFKIIDGSNSGVTLKKLFNEKAYGFGKALWPILGIPGSLAEGYRLSTSAFQNAVGKKLQVYVKRGKSNKGNEFNDVMDFRPL